VRADLLKLAASFAEREERFAIVTVVRREPPSSAHVGDVALVTESGEYHGWTGGGCTRSSVLLEAMRAIADGKPRLLNLSPEAEGGERPGVVFLPMTCESGGTVEIYVEPVLPAARLVIFGSSPAARVLSRIAHAMGYRVEIVDPDADESAFPDAKVQRALVGDALPRGAHVAVQRLHYARGERAAGEDRRHRQSGYESAEVSSCAVHAPSLLRIAPRRAASGLGVRKRTICQYSQR